MITTTATNNTISTQQSAHLEHLHLRDAERRKQAHLRRPNCVAHREHGRAGLQPARHAPRRCTRARGHRPRGRSQRREPMSRQAWVPRLQFSVIICTHTHTQTQTHTFTWDTHAHPAHTFTHSLATHKHRHTHTLTHTHTQRMNVLAYPTRASPARPRRAAQTTPRPTPRDVSHPEPRIIHALVRTGADAGTHIHTNRHSYTHTYTPSHTRWSRSAAAPRS
jgi:hypothetical protein